MPAFQLFATCRIVVDTCWNPGQIVHCLPFDHFLVELDVAFAAGMGPPSLELHRTACGFMDARNDGAMSPDCEPEPSRKLLVKMSIPHHSNIHIPTLKEGASILCYCFFFALGRGHEVDTFVVSGSPLGQQRTWCPVHGDTSSFCFLVVHCPFY